MVRIVFGLLANVVTGTTTNGTVTGANPKFRLQTKEAIHNHPKDLPNPTRVYDRMELIEAYKPRNVDPKSSTTTNGTVTEANPIFSLQPKEAVLDQPKDLPNPMRGYDRVELDEAYKPHNIDPQLSTTPGNKGSGNQYTDYSFVTTNSKTAELTTNAQRLNSLYESLERYEVMLLDPNLPDSNRSDISSIITNKQNEIFILSAKTTPTINSEFKACNNKSTTKTFTQPAAPVAKRERAPCKKCGYDLTKSNGTWNGKHDPIKCAPGQPKFGHYMKECTTCKGTNGWHTEDCKDIPNIQVKA